MSDKIFSVNNLSCSYDGIKEHAVLYIDHFDISSGEIIFLLGASGSGKSTLLETLALMNNTLADGDIVFNSPDKGKLSYESLWHANNEKDISLTRRNYFSFIFQNTNLMENFTAYENICISGMIKDNRTQQESLAGANALMNKVGLPENQVGLSTLSANLSGGQRQRVAFVRALNSNFKVLFGDEPTGNLDEGNANELLSLIKNNLKPDQSAVIVSHDINLALNHATKIVCITKEADSKSGVLNPEYIFERKYWEALPKEDYLAFREKLSNLYKPDVSATIKKEEKSLISHSRDTNIKYKSLFLKKEGIALAGKYFINFLMMLAMMTLTFLAVGFANGSISYLKKKIDNPFVNWMTITIPYSKSTPEEVRGFITHLNKSEVKDKFGYNSVNAFAEQPFLFWSISKNTYIIQKGRSIDMSGDGDPMIKEILTPRNCSPNSTEPRKLSEKDLSIIVTERFLEQLGYPAKSPYIYMQVPVSDTATGSLINLRVPIQVKAIVKEIPGKVDFMYTNFFLQSYIQKSECTFDYRTKREMLLYFEGPVGDGNKIKAAMQSFFDHHIEYNKFSPSVDFANEPKDFTFNTGYIFTISVYPFEGYSVYDRIYNHLIRDSEIKNYVDNKTLYRIYDYYNFTPSNEVQIRYDYLSVNFRNLEQVRPFSIYVRNTLNDIEEKKLGNGLLEVDMAKVQEKENFLFLNNIATIVSYIVIIFGSMAISLFIFNLLIFSSAKAARGNFTRLAG